MLNLFLCYFGVYYQSELLVLVLVQHNYDLPKSNCSTAILFQFQVELGQLSRTLYVVLNIETGR